MRIPTRLAQLYGKENLHQIGARILAGGRGQFERNRSREAEMTGALDALAMDMRQERTAGARRRPRTTNPDKTPIAHQQLPAAATGATAAPAAAGRPPTARKTPARELTAAQRHSVNEGRLYAKLWPTKAKEADALSATEGSLHAKVSPKTATEPEPLAASDQGTWSNLFGEVKEVALTPSEEELNQKVTGRVPES